MHSASAPTWPTSDDEESKEHHFAQSFQLNLKVKGERKTMWLAIEVPEYYPHAPIQVQFEE